MKGKRYPLSAAAPPVSPPECPTWAWSSDPQRAPVFAASFSLKIERRFVRRVDHRVPSRESGCPGHKKQLLPVLVVWGAASLDPQPRLGRKTSVSQLQDVHEPAETCDVFHGFDCAGTLRELLQKEVALLRVRLGPTDTAHGFGDTVSCPFCPWLQLKNGKGCLHMHLVRTGPTGVSYAAGLSSCAP